LNVPLLCGRQSHNQPYLADPFKGIYLALPPLTFQMSQVPNLAVFDDGCSVVWELTHLETVDLQHSCTNMVKRSNFISCCCQLFISNRHCQVWHFGRDSCL